MTTTEQHTHMNDTTIYDIQLCDQRSRKNSTFSRVGNSLSKLNFRTTAAVYQACTNDKLNNLDVCHAPWRQAMEVC